MNKIKYLGYSLLPTVIWLLLQVVVAAALSFMIGFLLALGGVPKEITDYIQKDYLYIISVAMDAAFLIPGYFWYRKLKRRSVQKEEKCVPITWKTYVRLTFFGITVQLFVGMILMIVEMLAPELMQSHTEAMETLGMFSPTVFSIAYTVILAPITEELIYRGLTLKILQSAFPFRQANLLQALLFGMIHGNPVQGVYAFLIGILFGLTVKRYGNLKAAMLLHFVVNLFGVVSGSIYLHMLVRIFLSVVFLLFALLLKENNIHNNEKV